MSFKRVASPSPKSQVVSEQIIEEIRTGRFAVGVCLPSERELGLQMGVSRTVIREALSALQLSGIVDRRVGDGTYVVRTPTRPLSMVPLLELLAASTSIMEALQVREALEVSAAHLAIENSVPEDIARLESIVLAMRESIDREDFRRYLDLTLDFHKGIGAASGNTILEQAVAFVTEATRSNLWVVERNYNREVAESSFKTHKAIFDGIKNRDLAAVGAAVHSHYDHYPSLQQ